MQSLDICSLKATSLCNLFGDAERSGKHGLGPKKEVTDSEERDHFTAHLLLLFVSFQGPGRVMGGKGPRDGGLRARKWVACWVGSGGA